MTGKTGWLQVITSSSLSTYVTSVTTAPNISYLPTLNSININLFCYLTLLVQRIQELSGLAILDKLYMSITEHHVFLLMLKINCYNNTKPMWSNFDFLKNRCWYQTVLNKSYSLILLITFMNFKTNSPLKYKLNKYSTSVIFFSRIQ